MISAAEALAMSWVRHAVMKKVEQYPRAGVANESNQLVADEVRCPGLGHGRCERDHTANQEAGVPVDAAVRLGQRHDAEQDHRNRTGHARNCRRDQVEGQQPNEHDDNNNRFFRPKAKRHGLPPQQLRRVDD